MVFGVTLALTLVAAVSEDRIVMINSAGALVAHAHIDRYTVCFSPDYDVSEQAEVVLDTLNPDERRPWSTAAPRDGDDPAACDRACWLARLVEQMRASAAATTPPRPLDAPREYDDVANKYLRLVENAVTGSLTEAAGRCDPSAPNCPLERRLPYERELRERGTDWPTLGLTMVGHVRLRQLRRAIEEVVARGVPGDIVELGTWRGGAMIYAKAVLHVAERDDAAARGGGAPPRRVILFDAFDTAVQQYTHMAEYLSASAASVRASFEKFELWDGRVVIVAGLFEDALPRFDPAARVAVLRVDCNFYACHQDALYHLYERVPVGGIVIFDDILAHGELLRFWVEFKTEQGLREVLVRAGDDNCAWFRKEADVALDWSHFRGPEQLAGSRLD